MTLDELRAYFHNTNPGLSDDAFAGWVEDLKLSGLLAEQNGVFTKTGTWPETG